MNEERLKEIIQQTFSKLSCPANGNGLYAEIEKAVREAFMIGTSKRTIQIPLPGREESYVPYRA